MHYLPLNCNHESLPLFKKATFSAKELKILNILYSIIIQNKKQRSWLIKDTDHFPVYCHIHTSKSFFIDDYQFINANLTYCQQNLEIAKKNGRGLSYAALSLKHKIGVCTSTKTKGKEKNLKKCGLHYSE